jgi:tRNA nucleotidyltransferase (CCA-adding enzyme)
VDTADALGALGRSPLGRTVLELARQRSDVHLVGGYVRDTLLAREPREIDLVVEGDALQLTRALAERLRGVSVEHGRFGTATLSYGGERADLASARSESYAAPGQLPDVTLGVPLAVDLQRRDFTINALAITLGGPSRGQLHAAAHAEEDLAAGRLRVLHDASFRDDPTRLLRLARYAQRLGFDVEASTASLARAAVAGGGLATVSGTRVGAELRLALGEPDPVACLGRLGDMGVLAALDPRLACDAGLAAEALRLLPADGSPGLLALAVCARGFPDAESLRALSDELAFTAREREVVMAAALGSRQLAERLSAAKRPSELYAVAGERPLEEIALAGALGAAEPARCWMTELRHVALQISGDDLLAAGIPPGPEVGRRLRAALTRKLDGELAPDRHAELEAALAG